MILTALSTQVSVPSITVKKIQKEEKNVQAKDMSMYVLGHSTGTCVCIDIYNV
jgi:hypothetical protein